MSSVFSFQSSDCISSVNHPVNASARNHDVIVCSVCSSCFLFAFSSDKLRVNLREGSPVSSPAVTSSPQLFSSSVSCPPAQRRLTAMRRRGGSLEYWLNVTLTKPPTPCLEEHWLDDLCSTSAHVSLLAFCHFSNKFNVTCLLLTINVSKQD